MATKVARQYLWKDKVHICIIPEKSGTNLLCCKSIVSMLLRYINVALVLRIMRVADEIAYGPLCFNILCSE